MPDRPEIDVLCRLLERGINVVTALVMFNHRDSLEPEWRRPIEAACERGGATLHASGSTPGFSTETLPLAFTSIMRRIDCITQTECCDMSSRNSPEMIFDQLGFGRDPATMGALPVDPAHSLGPSLRMTAAALSLPLGDLRSSTQYAVARRDLDIAAGRIVAGTVAGMRMELVGSHAGRPVIRRRAVWYMTRDLDPGWDMPPDGWHYPVVNAIPYVCKAAPGIRQTDELPMIIGNFSR